MSTGFFGVLRDESDDDTSSSSSSGSSDRRNKKKKKNNNNNRRKERQDTKPTHHGIKSHPPSANAHTHIPAYEDLSTSRADEETVLQAVYVTDFSCCPGPWGSKKLQVHVKPPDVEDNQVGTELTLSVQVGKKYPYVLPVIELVNVKGLSKGQQQLLLQQLADRSKELAISGHVMMVELVQIVEDFLLEHNDDPNLSAWEQMRAREAAEQERAVSKVDELSRILDGTNSNLSSNMNPSSIGNSTDRAPHASGVAPKKVAYSAAATSEIEKELQRQRQALEDAHRNRTTRTSDFRKQVSFSNTVNAKPERVGFLGSDDDGDDEDNDDYDEDDYDLYDQTNMYASLGQAGGNNFVPSRYQCDFVEMGVLGRGGGGEVVKVRNRLDRRIYAVKKIILESEMGAAAKFGKVHNQKLRREVTTISRMTHKNIVRYYQAWVEGGMEASADISATEMTDIPSGDGLDEDEDDSGDSSSSSDKTSESDDDDDDSNAGWWTNSPSEHFLSNHTDRTISNSAAAASKDRDKSASDFDGLANSEDSNSDSDGIDLSRPLPRQNQKRDLHSSSMLNLLEHENDYGLQSPLLAGLGFQNELLQTVYDDSKQRKSSKTANDSDNSGDFWDESSVKVGSTSGRMILYIQMEYCSTTLRRLIDKQTIGLKNVNEVWRMIRQILEALIYIHEGGVIHRDLKPANIFVDGNGDVKLGDFGLATRHRENKPDDSQGKDENDSEAHTVYSAIDDISHLLGRSAHGSKSSFATSNADESMTGGVGTTFYRAPEQEGQLRPSQKKKEGSAYTVQADVFSLGIIIFEMFHPPFDTYMERAEILTTLRGCDDASRSNHSVQNESHPSERFPPKFVETVPQNARQIILWCLERDPSKRPNAEQLLASDLMPRKLELEQRYLEEALELLTSSQSDSHIQILEAFFTKPNSDLTELTFDTDLAAKANNIGQLDDGIKRTASLSESLFKAIGNIRAGSIDVTSLRTVTMSASSMIAATAALSRAKAAGMLGKGGKGMLKRSAQRMAGILAMKAASSAAVTGAFDGVHGADASVVQTICDKIKVILENHGAVHLQSPLLRPRTSIARSVVGGPAELINARGTVLLLPEDLTASFARTIGRGGTATSNLKRYDIGKVYHKSMIGGHPRESLEASFDIVHEDHKQAINLIAESIFVASEVAGILPRGDFTLRDNGRHSPPWFLRLTHTKLADAILDLCGIPQKESIRHRCFQLLSTFTVPGLSMVANNLSICKRKAAKKNEDTVNTPKTELQTILDTMEADKYLQPEVAAKFRCFMELCSPLPINVLAAIDTLKTAISKVASLEKALLEPKRAKRFEDAARGLKALKNLIEMLDSTQNFPIADSAQAPSLGSSICQPLYIALDLGLRQRRKHYHGGILYNCIVLPDDYFEDMDNDITFDSLVSSSGRGVKFAEGGEYNDLVRKYRPPGNFGSALFNFYTQAPIPVCVGVRVTIGRLVEFIYLHIYSKRARTNSDLKDIVDIDKRGIEVLRNCLGHPFDYVTPIKCIVASTSGMDAESAPERFLVASRLWAGGIAAEYLTHSGVMLSLLKRIRDDANPDPSNSDWSLAELMGVCALMKIEYMVVVQPHLLKDKGSVRLRRVEHNKISQFTSPSEVFVLLDDLADTIRSNTGWSDDQADDNTDTMEGALFGLNIREKGVSSHSCEVECIYVDNDQYFGSDREISKSETANWKSYLKIMKGVSLSAENYLASLVDSTSTLSAGTLPVFAVADVTFWCLRDFGTSLMRREHKEQSATGASLETIERYPKYKRSIKTLASAIDSFMRRQGLWSGISSSHTSGGSRHRGNSWPTGRSSSPSPQASSSALLTALLYSKLDDRFDMISLPYKSKNLKHGNNSHSSSRRRG